MHKFLFGTASSSHQVEGGNIHNQIYELEQSGEMPKVGAAADFAHQYKADINTAKDFGMNAMRISLEWSRLIPYPGEWNSEAVAYYKDVFKIMGEAGITPMVTLFHWTVPAWVYQQGFNSEFARQQFEHFVAKAVQEFGKEVNQWLVINEPEVFAFEINLIGKNLNIFEKTLYGLRTYLQQIRMHNSAWRIIRAIDPTAQIGVAKNVAYHEPFRQDHLLDRLVVWVANTFGNELFVHLIKSRLDFIGLNYYFYHSLAWSWQTGFQRKNLQTIKSDMGEKTYPKGLYFLLKQFWKFKKPLYVTENGIGNARDEMRFRFIEEHLQAALSAKQEGVNVAGYFYWSLTDTHEWKSGFNIRFGLVEVNPETGQRRIRSEFNTQKLQQILEQFD